MTRDLLKKFLDDRCSGEELGEIIAWIKKDACSDTGKDWAYQDWKDFGEVPDSEDKEQFDALLNNIHRKIIAKNSNHRERTIVRLGTWLTRAAAILFLPLLGFLVYSHYSRPEKIAWSSGSVPDTVQVITPTGSRTVVQLPDGSVVHLNHGSRLSYPQHFTGRIRGVVLLGEGYFKVIHDPQRPFLVNTGNLNIKALGTEFNVQSYPGEKTIATTLVNGKVTVERTCQGGGAFSDLTLVPGQHISFDMGKGNFLSSQGKIEKYIAWKDGKLVFDNESITEVAGRLSRQFNVDIDVADNARYFTYTVTFVDEPLFQILDLMKIATPVKYKVLPRVKMPDGTYSKQKIILEKRN
jgi:ferric-dicitrate binding protein FerR (iron transport regulator)